MSRAERRNMLGVAHDIDRLDRVFDAGDDDRARGGRGVSGDVAIDLAGSLFFADNTQCAPVSLAVGRSLGVAYHLDDAGNVVSDAAMLVP